MSSAPTAVIADQPVVWTPGPERISRSRALAFAREHGLDGWDAIGSRAAEDPGWFWGAVSDHLGIVWTRPYDSVLDLSNGPEWPDWFVGGRMNYVASALDRFLDRRADQTALIWEGDDGSSTSMTYRELAESTNRIANALRGLGIRKGDRVGIYLPMLPETAVATLACSRIGAVFIPIFSGYGADAASKRLIDAEAKVLITADGFHRRGGVVPMKDTANAAVANALSVEHVIVVRRCGVDPGWVDGRDLWWHDLERDASPHCEPEDTAADDPYMLIYTSGTTGTPKGTVHVHAGFPIKAAQDLAFCFDLQSDDRLFWITDLGWMMGPWMIAGGLIAGASIVVYEGTPDYPEPDRLWQVVERHGATVLGVSPTLVRSLMGHGDEWVDRHELATLRALGSTGEPWNPGPWRWAFEHVGKSRCPIVNYSGGTEISGGIVAATTIHPQKPCAFSGPVPGVPADVVNETGQPVRGEVGELVIRGPWVGMTNGFWRDRERYLDTYWARMPGMWVHGDWALIDDDGFWYILGRSDDTLNVAGKRIGPAEIESAAVAHPAVQEAAAIGVPHEIKGEAIVVFVTLKPGHLESEHIRSGIRDLVAQQLGRPLRPDLILFVDDLPKTRNAKIVRRVIRARRLNQANLGDLSSLENFDAVEGIARAR
ncbi:MAG TPA: AMP-binding protein [Thermomicrobiales bacterium]|nr:AMP-binding protein [Thermomicrobiales bacterium]